MARARVVAAVAAMVGRITEQDAGDGAVGEFVGAVEEVFR